ncbi:hypothetical protein O9929_21105 [Vibrio lentus]|nr:hypothetical protein [Vibrio lentus]
MTKKSFSSWAKKQIKWVNKYEASFNPLALVIGIAMLLQQVLLTLSLKKVLLHFWKRLPT